MTDFDTLRRWRLIADHALPGAINMARDVALLEAVAAGDSPPTLRFYSWSPPCLSLGKHQTVEAADLDFCDRHGLDVVRRPTGGRAVLHHIELTYAVIAPLGDGPLPRGLQEAYARICGGLVRACHTLGVHAELSGGEVNLRLPGPRSTVPCFEAPAGGEVMVRGRKLIGSAMRAHDLTILQHGSILLDWDSELQSGAMGQTDDCTVRPHVTTLAEELGFTPTHDELAETIIDGLEQELGIQIHPGHFSRRELARADELRAEFQILDA